MVLEDIIHLLAVQGSVQSARSLWAELEAVTQLLQHSCLGCGFIQSPTGHFLP